MSLYSQFGNLFSRAGYTSIRYNMVAFVFNLYTHPQKTSWVWAEREGLASIVNSWIKYNDPSCEYEWVDQMEFHHAIFEGQINVPI